MNDPFFARLVTGLSGADSEYLRRADPDPTTTWDLDMGEARYPLPADLRIEMGRAASEVDLWYSSPAGERSLREAYRTHLSAGHTDTDIDPGRVLVTGGGKEAAWLAVRYLLHRHHAPAVLVPSPGWEPYRLWLDASGCRQIPYDPIAVAAHPSLLRRLITTTPETPALLILNYPHNPTGVGIGQDHMNAIIAMAADFGIAVVSDEVYRAFGEPGVSAVFAPHHDPRRHLVVDSCSKTLAAAGLRVGFLTAHAEVVNALTAVRATYASCTSVLNQRIAAHLLTSTAARGWLADTRVDIHRVRAGTAEALAERGIEVVSHGGLYIWARLPAPATLPRPTSQATTGERARITSGTGFGVPECFRVCTARSGLDPETAADAVLATVRRR